MLRQESSLSQELPSPERHTVSSVRSHFSLEGLEYRPDIDGLRAIAILAVLGFHASSSLLPGGFCGVDIFFVISGFLITGIIQKDLRSGRFSFRQFYTRRARRLFPALSVVLLASILLGWPILLPDEFRQLGVDATAGAAFSANLLLYSDAAPYFLLTGQRVLMHMWSLGIEEQFYFIWPTIIYAAWNFGKRVFIAALVVLTASFFENIHVSSLDTPAAFYLPWSRLWELALGAMLAASTLTSRPHPSQINATQEFGFLWRHIINQRLNIFGWCGVGLLIWSLWGLDSGMEYPGFWGLVPSMGAALVILAGPKAWFSRHVLSRRPLVFIGLISYPLYLWHWPLLCFSRMVEPNVKSPLLQGIVVILIAFVLALATYRLIELPVRRARGRPLVLATVCLMLTLCGIAGYMTSARFISPRQIPPEVERLMLPASDNAVKA